MINVFSNCPPDPAYPLSRREIGGLIEKILAALGHEGASLDITLVGDDEMANANIEYLGCVGPTNILSFPAEDREDPDRLGELVLSVDTLRRETRLYGQEPLDYLVRLLSHGILHLAGHEHGQIMDELTDAAIASVCRKA